ncbi:FMN-binding negative transcriptional regulator [Pseudomonas fluorescens]|uniref:FMN-binding negative transcriptional regulator n=1 Tax=Pseudomonas fluorescens TaxID=294 RepID=A0A944HCK8_PSEFL|nr:FMN-binding negative transcriptional regulator [Pseudomonas fluorescens]MBT2294971.1 FMN-binding negative transcriptional regulator [Pseudomonas fluorescens]MBT2309199.1 FMN-binding negative transcriptional regulator [Pseudomonas fluorescens]MBT2313667.1 FMN-binding negative transcriptional regulator [Pseudomonas fluorescens]MBT2318383.1 FMN-binding negative transcriptional regulator [Pseudomonas fluorescens]MBT2329306.1 FMN-binding negative transcriptional regulator [Pseudomonas fluorescen
MYNPNAFAVEDLPQLHGMMNDCRLAVLITQGERGLLASHLPLLLDTQQGPHGSLYGHMARANPQWRDLEAGAEALVVFAGADAYVSPGFYPSKAEHGKVVPTWNYLAVHAYGTAEVFSEPHRLRNLVGALTDRHESGRGQPWTIDDAPTEYIDSMLRAIVGFALPIQRLEGKRKLSQNRSPADVSGVRNGLAASPVPQDQALAHLMPDISSKE